jgi:CheY-like chemotaxis protein
VPREKRRTARVQTSATVVLLDGQHALGSHRVLNLSVGGALLVGRAPAARPTHLEVLVRLSTGQVIRAGASVVREESVDDNSVFAIEFSDVSPEDREAIDNLRLTAVEDERDPTALVVAHGPDLRHLLRRHLTGLGHRVFEVSTLENTMKLLGAPNAVAVVLVDLALDTSEVQGLLTYLAEKHPKIRRLVLGLEGAAARPALLLDGAPLVDAVVPSPWTRESLTRALGQ